MALDDDADGTESFQILDGANAKVAEVTEDGTVYSLVGFDGIGAVDLDYGSADITDHTFVTDSTGDGEIVLPNDSIGSAEIDSTTGAYDFGGVTSLEIPNSTSLPGTCAVGQIYMDTDATSGQRIYACQSTDTWALQGDGGGAGGGATEVILPIYSAKLTGSFVVDGDATQGAQIDAGDGNWRLLFDATTDEGAVWQFRMPNNYSSTPVLKIQYTMASATANEVEFEGAIMCVSDGDSADVGTASFSSIAVGYATVPGTAGYPDEISITLTDDSCTAGDSVWIYLSTDSDDATNDDATGDREVINVSLSYTGA
jgi:hypothetical protein